MPSTFRPIYEDQAVILKLDSSLTAAGLTATNFVWCGASNWTLTLASGATAASDLTIQTNSSNFIAESITGINWNGQSVSGLTPSSYNSSFTANWIDLAVLSSGYNMISITNIPCRYIRLSGTALSSTGCYAYLWTDTMLQQRT